MKLILLFFFALCAAPASAQPFELSYAGRLVDAQGKPVAGLVDLQLKLFTHETNPTLIAVTIPVFEDVSLASGMFQVKIELTPAEYHIAFNGTDDVWVEAKDVTHNKTYPRQHFSAVPYALKVPVDGVTVLYDADGKLRAVTSGTGNMNTGTYDTTGTIGIVDQAEDAQTLSGEAATDFHDAAQLTGTINDARLSATVTNLGDDIGLASEVSGVLPVANLPVGTTGAHVAAGNDARFTDSRAPNGTAGGGLAGTYPNPTISSVPDGALSGTVTKLGSDIDLNSAETTGLLPVSKGGSGAGTLTGLLKGNGTGAFTSATLTDIPVGFRLNAADGAPTDALFVDNAGLVGIATSTPTYSLDVNGTARVSNTATFSGTVDMDGSNFNLGNTWFRLGAGAAFRDNGAAAASFYNSAVTTIRHSLNLASGDSYLANGGGNVGIGTTSPAAPLHILGNGAGAALATSGATDATMNARACRGNVCIDQGMLDSGVGYIQNRRFDNFATNYNLAINPNGGHVGVGTTNPTQTLTVIGNNPGNYALGVANLNATGSGIFVAPGVDTNPGLTVSNAAQTNSRHLFYGSGDAVLAYGAGSVGIGTLTPSAKLEVAGVAGTDGIKYPDGTLQTTAMQTLTANRDYYVRTDGSDSNTGLSNTSGGAFLTIQKAIDTAAKIVLNGKVLTINVADGTYTTPVVVSGPWIGQGIVQILGNTGSPQNVLINVTGTNAISVINGTLSVSGVEMRTNGAGGAAAIYAIHHSTVSVGPVRFGTCLGAHLAAFRSSVIEVNSNYTISGSASYHYIAEHSSSVIAAGRTITVTGTPTFNYFAVAQFSSSMRFETSVFSGAANGIRYLAQLGGVIYNNGGGANFFPGNVAGSVGAASVYQ